MLEVFIIILRSGEVFTSFNKHNSANFSGKKKKGKLVAGVYILRIHEKKFKSNLVP